MADTRRYAFRRYLGFVCLLILVTLALALLGWAPTRKLAGADGVPAMLAGIGVSLVASLAGGLPILAAERRRGGVEIRDTLASLVARFLVVLTGALYVLLLGAMARAPFLVWVAISYLALLPVDVRYSLRGRPPAAAADRGNAEPQP